MIDNPMTTGINHVNDQLSQLNFSGSNFVPSFISFLVMWIVKLIFMLLWPYGMIAVITSLIGELIFAAVDDMRGKAFFEQLPFILAIGIYFIVSSRRTMIDFC